MSELSKHTRLFKNVKMCKDLNWQEKAILSEIISYQLDEKPFKVKDLTLAIELGMDKGTISKLINRLYKKGLLDKTTVSFPSLEGGKPKRQRTVTVNNIERWTEKGKTAPTVKPIENKALIVETIIDVPVKQEPVSQPKKIKVEPSLEQMLSEAESKNVDIAISNKIEPNSDDVITIDAFNDVDNSTATGNIIANKIRNNEPIEFINVLVKFGENDFLKDEAMIIPNSLNKYYLKSLLKQIDANVID